MIRGSKDEDPVILKFIDYFLNEKKEVWEVVDEDVRWGAPDKNYDYLLRNTDAEALMEVEVTALHHLVRNGGSSAREYIEHFKKLEGPLLELARKNGFGANVIFRVYTEYIDALKTHRPHKRPEALLEMLIGNKKEIIYTKRNNVSGLPSAVLKFGGRYGDDIAFDYGLIYRGMKKIFEKKSAQLSDDKSHQKIVLIVDNLPFRDVVEQLCIEAKRIMEVEGYEQKVKAQQIFFYDGRTERFEKIYPSSVKLSMEFVVVGEDEEGGWILEEKK